MDRINGEDLNVYLKTNGAASSLQIVKDLGRQILNGINHLHSKNIIHLDIKPSNIMIANDQQVKIIDLGIAM